MIGQESNSNKFVFIIDEINRAEIAKVFGELFFSIDPDYRGKESSILTQYASLHDDPNELFYIPKNVYIIGTMNDIDRSVDTFDFAMRRRFTFIEITSEESAQNILEHEDTVNLMGRVNEALSDPNIGGLSSDYHIGASFFMDYDQNKDSKENLWNYKIKPLLKDYFLGQHRAHEKILRLREEFFYEDVSDESDST